jgi:hypothetical protein
MNTSDLHVPSETRQMKQLTFPFILSLSVFAVLTGCEKSTIEPSDELEKFGILGEWSLQSTTINGITDMIVHYDTLAFTTGMEIHDQKGEFRSAGPGHETSGRFELDPANNTIIFDYDSTQKWYEFLISGDYMTFKYNEDSIEFIEDWRKAE